MPNNKNIRFYRAKSVTNYRKPKIRKHKSGWYIEYYFYHEDEWHRLRYKQDMNRIKDLKKRLVFAKEVQTALNQMLMDGWNPFTMDQEYSLLDCITMLLEEIEASSSTKTLSHYRSVWGKFHKWCEHKGIGININHITADHITEFISTKNHLSPAGRNRYVQGLKNLYNRLKDKGIVSENLVREKSKKSKGNKNIPLNIEERDRIKEYLADHHPRFLLFIEVMFYTGLRPNEILSLKYSNIYSTGIIVESKSAKTRTQRTAPLNDYLRGKLIGKGDEYIFGKGMVSQERESPLHRNRVTELWRDLIKVELGIDKTLYSIRHLSAIEHWKINKDLYALRDFLGHSTISMTENYMRSLVGFNLELNTNSGIKF